MGETADRIAEEIDDARGDLDRDLNAFEAKLERRTDWTIWIVVGCALALGLLITKAIRS